MVVAAAATPARAVSARWALATGLPAFPSSAASAFAIALCSACDENGRRLGAERAAELAGPWGCAAGHRPSVDLTAYIERLLTYIPAARTDLAYTLALVDRSGVALTWASAHRLVAVALVVAVKFALDAPPTNKFYADVAGVDVRELNALEIELLGRIEFRAWLGDDVVAEYERLLDESVEDDFGELPSTPGAFDEAFAFGKCGSDDGGAWGDASWRKRSAIATPKGGLLAVA
eukprot:m51a1_g9385 hypothetical protein (233) ;mRNA; f:228661-229359